MSKPAHKVILVPGATGWEIWTGQPESGFVQHDTAAVVQAGDLTALPPGEVTMLFPVGSITSIPLRVTTEDESLFPELATMHSERLGLRPDPMAGQLEDVFVVAREGEAATLLAVHLRVPAEGELPPRGPKEFDLSARAFPVAGDCLAVWKEFGRWVFAFHLGGQLAYCQATAISSPAPDEALVREIQLAQIQLSLQGIDFDPACVEVWTLEEMDTSALSSAFRRVVAVNPRPAPVLPTPRSRLLPADVRAARREAARRRNITLAAAAVVLGYVGLIGYLGYNIWQIKAETTRLQQRARILAPDKGDYDLFMARWGVIEKSVAQNQSALELLFQVARNIPSGSGLRLTSAEITADQINIVGEAAQPAAINQFSLAINRSKELAGFKWQTPSPSPAKTGWGFTYNGTRGGPE